MQIDDAFRKAACVTRHSYKSSERASNVNLNSPPAHQNQNLYNNNSSSSSSEQNLKEERTRNVHSATHSFVFLVVVAVLFPAFFHPRKGACSWTLSSSLLLS